MNTTISADDMNIEAVCASVSRSTYKTLTIEAQKLGITRTEFVELAICTAIPDSPQWQQTWQRISVINEARKSMARLKRSIAWQQKMTPEESRKHKSDILSDLAKTGLKSQDVKARLENMGIALSV